LPTTYLLQISSEKLAICCANNGGTQLLRRVQDRLFSCLLFCRQTSFSAKQENPLSKASCGIRRRKQQHLLGTTTHVATPEWIWVLLTEERILAQICWSLLSLNPTYPQQHRLLLLFELSSTSRICCDDDDFLLQKHRHHAWLVDFSCISGTNYTLAHSCLQRTKGKMMGASSSSSSSSQRRRST